MLTLVADIGGAGPAVVLLHGQPGSAADWSEVTARLRTDHTVIVPDRLGYGRTGGRAGGFAANADAAVRLLDDANVDRAVVAGHSWGGGVAIALMQRRPDRVVGAVLIAPVVPVDRPGRLDRLLAVPVLAPAVASVALGAAGRALSWPPVRRAIGGWRGGLSDDQLQGMADSWRRRESWRSFVIEQRALVGELPGLAAGLGAIRVPVTVVVGTADRIVPASGGARLAGAIPGATLVRMERAGHLLMAERPGEIAAAISRMSAPGGRR
jgi:pimeloyl-ACP methyl ester carboxylesterase